MADGSNQVEADPYRTDARARQVALALIRADLPDAGLGTQGKYSAQKYLKSAETDNYHRVRLWRKERNKERGWFARRVKGFQRFYRGFTGRKRKVLTSDKAKALNSSGEMKLLVRRELKNIVEGDSNLHAAFKRGDLPLVTRAMGDGSSSSATDAQQILGNEQMQTYGAAQYAPQLPPRPMYGSMPPGPDYGPVRYDRSEYPPMPMQSGYGPPGSGGYYPPNHSSQMHQAQMAPGYRYAQNMDYAQDGYVPQDREGGYHGRSSQHPGGRQYADHADGYGGDYLSTRGVSRKPIGGWSQDQFRDAPYATPAVPYEDPSSAIRRNSAVSEAFSHLSTGAPVDSGGSHTGKQAATGQLPYGVQSAGTGSRSESLVSSKGGPVDAQTGLLRVDTGESSRRAQAAAATTQGAPATATVAQPPSQRTGNPAQRRSQSQGPAGPSRGPGGGQ
ncbi:hypothetical protein GCM10027575_00830 [Phytohabitans suffuscus]